MTDSWVPSRRLQGLLDNQRERWERGERASVEEFLAGDSTIQDDESLVLDLIYGEFCLREALGESPRPEEYVQRFPRLAAPLNSLFDAHYAANSEAMASFDAAGDTTRTYQWADDSDGFEVQSPAAIAGPSRAPPSAGEKFGRYVLGPRFAAGGMGTVHKAHDTLLDIPVALKFLRNDEGGDSERSDLMLAEARALARVFHPNLCRIFDCGQLDHHTFLAMGLVDGTPLEHSADVPPRKTADLVRTIALALEDSHAVGVIHRDLKPANILLTERGRPVVVDFGLAVRSWDDLRQQGTDRGIAGTVPYMAPEQWSGDAARLDARTDVYGLGIVLYELLTGRPPFLAEDLWATAKLIVDSAVLPAAPSTIRAEVDASLDAICLKAIEKDPTRRFASMIEFAASLEDYLSRGETAGLIDRQAIEISFLPAGTGVPTSLEHQDRLCLDVGNHVGPGVLDHHSAANAAKSTTSLVIERPEFVLSAVKPWRRRDAAFSIAVHEHPDLDSVAAIYLATELLSRGALPALAKELSAYVDSINEGSCGLSSGNRYSLYSAYMLLSHRLSLRSWPNSESYWEQLAREGREAIAFVLQSAERSGRSIESIDAFEAHSLFGVLDRREVDADFNRYEQKLRDPETHARYAKLWLPSRDGGNIEIATLFVRNVQDSTDPDRCMFFKDWARSDGRRAPSSDGFAGLCICGSDTMRNVRHCVISVRPGSHADLSRLAHVLDEQEAAARRRQFGVDDRTVDPSTGQDLLPRAGYENADPWYDGRAHDGTIIGSPSRGTLLTIEQIEEAIASFGERSRAEFEPLTSL